MIIGFASPWTSGQKRAADAFPSLLQAGGAPSAMATRSDTCDGQLSDAKSHPPVLLSRSLVKVGSPAGGGGKVASRRRRLSAAACLVERKMEAKQQLGQNRPSVGTANAVCPLLTLLALPA